MSPLLTFINRQPLFFGSQPCGRGSFLSSHVGKIGNVADLSQLATFGQDFFFHFFLILLHLGEEFWNRSAENADGQQSSVSRIIDANSGGWNSTLP